MSRRSRARFGEMYEAVTKDIYAFSDALNFQPTWQQRQLLDAVHAVEQSRRPGRIAVRSGQGPGKTTTSVVVGLYRILSRPWSKLIVTAPTMKQCKDVWLAEAELLCRRASPAFTRLFNFTNTTIGIMGQKAKNWGCLVQTATTAEGAQGQHREDMDVIVEEASGVEDAMIEQYQGTLSNPNALLLLIGNPNTRTCKFFDCFHANQRMWPHLLHWNAEETPASKWFDPQRNEDIAKEYGRDSDVYRVRVLGEFPHADPGSIFDDELIQSAIDTPMLEAAMAPGLHATVPRKQFGIDIARFGGDESVIFQRSGNAITNWKYWHHVEPARICEMAMKWQEESGWSDNETMFVADAGGMGQGVMHKFHDRQKRLLEFHTQGIPSDDQFANAMTEAWFGLRKLMRSQPTHIPNDAQLRKQLTARIYLVNRNGKLIIESKDEYKKRLDFPSPDRADALVMAYYQHAIWRMRTMQLGARKD